MKIIYELLILMLLFSAGSLTGWTLEVFYRRFKLANKERVWINPGFLSGPYLPLYGFGLTMLYLLALTERFIPIADDMLRKGVLFVVMALAMTIIELIAGELFIIRRHLKLWDYSQLKFNYKGIICLRFSFYWALLGAVYYFFIHPRILTGLEWFSRNPLFSFFIGAFYGILIMDLTNTFKLTAKIKTFAEENEMVIRYEELKRHIRREAIANREIYRFMRSFESERSIKESLKGYLTMQLEMAKLGNLNDFLDDALQHIKKNQ